MITSNEIRSSRNRVIVRTERSDALRELVLEETGGLFPTTKVIREEDRYRLIQQLQSPIDGWLLRLKPRRELREFLESIQIQCCGQVITSIVRRKRSTSSLLH